jgi:hypothetical protein
MIIYITFYILIVYRISYKRSLDFGIPGMFQPALHPSFHIRVTPLFYLY